MPNVIVTAEVVDDSEVADYEEVLMRKLRRHLHFSMIREFTQNDAAVEEIAAQIKKLFR